MSEVIKRLEVHVHEDVIRLGEETGVPPRFLEMISHIMYDDSFSIERPEGKDGDPNKKWPTHETPFLTTAGGDIEEKGPDYDVVRDTAAVTQEINRIAKEYQERVDPNYKGYSEEEWITLKLKFAGREFDKKAADTIFKEAGIIGPGENAELVASSVRFGKPIELPFKLEKADIPRKRGKLQFKTCEVHLGIIDADPRLIDILLHMGFEYAIMPAKADGTRAHFFTAQSRDMHVMYQAANALHYLLEELGGYKAAVLQSEVITGHQHHGDVRGDKDLAQHAYKIAVREGFAGKLECGNDIDGYTIGGHSAADIKKWELGLKLKEARATMKNNPSGDFSGLKVGKNWLDGSDIAEKGTPGKGMK